MHILATLSARKARTNGGLAVKGASDELKCPDASRMSGSDYDGETVVVIGDEQIVQASVNASEIHRRLTPRGLRHCARQCLEDRAQQQDHPVLTMPKGEGKLGA